MKLLDALERRFGRFAIPNLPLVIVMGQGLVLGLSWTEPADPGGGGGGLLQKCSLSAAAVMTGEWWRLLTFIFVPPGISLLVLFALYLFLVMGKSLEAEWGSFRFNVYCLLGYLASIGAAFLQPAETATCGYLAGSIFLAFAWLNPEFQILLMFLVPVKIKFLAWLTWLFYAWRLASGDMLDRLLVLAAVFNFLVFFSAEIVQRLRSNQRRRKFAAAESERHQTPFHTCAVCGRTEQDDAQMLFRFCSQCTGEHEYCEEHLENHSHIGQTGPENQPG